MALFESGREIKQKSEVANPKAAASREADVDAQGEKRRPEKMKENFERHGKLKY